MQRLPNPQNSTAHPVFASPPHRTTRYLSLSLNTNAHVALLQTAHADIPKKRDDNGQLAPSKQLTCTTTTAAHVLYTGRL